MKHISIDFDDTLTIPQETDDRWFSTLEPRISLINQLKNFQETAIKISIITAREENEHNKEEITSFLKQHFEIIPQVYFSDKEVKWRIAEQIGSELHLDDSIAQVILFRLNRKNADLIPHPHDVIHNSTTAFVKSQNTFFKF